MLNLIEWPFDIAKKHLVSIQYNNLFLKYQLCKFCCDFWLWGSWEKKYVCIFIYYLIGKYYRVFLSFALFLPASHV